MTKTCLLICLLILNINSIGQIKTVPASIISYKFASFSLNKDFALLSNKIGASSEIEIAVLELNSKKTINNIHLTLADEYQAWWISNDGNYILLNSKDGYDFVYDITHDTVIENDQESPFYHIPFNNPDALKLFYPNDYMDLDYGKFWFANHYSVTRNKNIFEITDTLQKEKIIIPKSQLKGLKNYYKNELSISENGTYLCYNIGNKVNLYNLKTERFLFQEKLSIRNIQGLHVNNDGNICIAGKYQQETTLALHWYDLKSKTFIHHSNVTSQTASLSDLKLTTDTVYKSRDFILIKSENDTLFRQIEFDYKQKIKAQGNVYIDLSQTGNYEYGIPPSESYEDFFELNEISDQQNGIVKTGVWELFLQINGENYLKRINYNNGKRTGRSYTTHYNGDTLWVQTYKNNQLNGLSIDYNYLNGELLSKDSLYYLNDKKHGPYMHHYAFGQLHERGQFDHDERIGEWLQNDPFGKQTKVNYKDGYPNDNTKVKLILSKKSENDKNYTISQNGIFALGENGDKKVVYNLQREVIRNGAVPLIFEQYEMGNDFKELSNSGQYFMQTYPTGMERWRTSIQATNSDHNFHIKGFYLDIKDDTKILYKDNYIYDFNFKLGTKDSLQIKNFQDAAYANKEDHIYIGTSTTVYFYSTLEQGVIDSIKFNKINTNNFIEYTIENDQLIVCEFKAVDDSDLLQLINIIWIDLLSKEVKTVPLPDISYDINGYCSSQFKILSSANRNILGIYTPCSKNGEKEVAFFNHKWNTITFFNENLKDIRLNQLNQFVFYEKNNRSYQTYQLNGEKIKEFTGFPMTASINDASCKQGILSFSFQNNKTAAINLANFKKETFIPINHFVDSTQLNEIDATRTAEEVLYFLEDSEHMTYNNLLQGSLNKLFYFDGNHKVSQISYNQRQNILIFENYLAPNRIEQVVYAIADTAGNFTFFTPDNYFTSFNSEKNIVLFEMRNKTYPLEQFDLKYNRPDIILDRLGYADSSLIAAYHAAYLKRLKKMGFTEDMLEDDFHLPEIKIENFEEMPTLHDQGSIDLKLKLEDSKYKLDRINVWVNDVAIYGSDGISLRDKDVQDYSTTLKVDLAKGKNKVQVSVLNQAGAESYKETFEIECTAGKKEPNLYLITIGESEFEQADFNLTYAAKDAQDIATLFQKSKAYKQVFTKTLVNQEVTKENVIALKSFLAEADINDEVMIFIAGHGVLDANLDYFFATYDMDFVEPNKKGLAYEDVERLLDGIKPLKKTLMIDACHSGEIDKDEVLLAEAEAEAAGDIQFRAVGNTATPKLGTQNTSELTKSLFTDLRKGTGATVISSAGGMEFAMEGDDWQNGLFTYCFINGIKTKAADYDKNGEIWLSEIKRYVSEQVTELSNGKQQPSSRIDNQVINFRIW